jgi:hypothetical protein
MDPQKRRIRERDRRGLEQLVGRRPAHPARQENVRDRRHGRVALENDHTA